MSNITSHDDAGYWRDPLEKIFWVYRDEDPKEYSHICPHCQKRYGEKRMYVTIRRCDNCPKFFEGMDTPWDIYTVRKKELKKFGHFSNKPRGGKRRKDETMVNTPMAKENGEGNKEAR